MLFGEMSDVCSKNRTICINTLCGQNAQFLTGTEYQQSGFKVCVCVGGRGRLTFDSSALNARLEADKEHFLDKMALSRAFLKSNLNFPCKSSSGHQHSVIMQHIASY